MQIPEPYILEMRYQDKLEREKPKQIVYAQCSYCDEPILFDEGTWESEFVETDDGLMHAECAREYFRDWIQAHKQTKEYVEDF